MIIKKPRVLVFTNFYLPGYKSGGPVRTIANMAERLGADIEFLVVTSDRDMQDNRSYDNIEIDVWTTAYGINIFYASPEKLSLIGIKRIIDSVEYDIIYLNSFFNPTFTIKPLLIRYFFDLSTKTTVIAPRGEFSPGALTIKRFKKSMYLKFSKVISLYEGLIWQASSDYELKDIKRELGNTANNIVIAPDIPALPNPDSDCSFIRTAKTPLRLVFLSRISPKKNLDFALEVLQNITCEVEFAIYGVVDDKKYWEKCKKLISCLPKNVNASFKGAVEHCEVGGVLSQYDMFFFPTRGENYGHVIYEAFSAGLVVLTSDQTPWRNLIDHGVGFDLSLTDIRSFVKEIEGASVSMLEIRGAARARAREYAKVVSLDPEVESKNMRLFLDLV